MVSLAPDAAVSREDIVLRYTNNSDIPYSFGHYYTLQMLVLCEWETVAFPLSTAFLLTEFGVQPNSYVDFPHSLQDFENLHGGRYRIIRKFMPFNDDQHSQIIEVIFEFEL